MVEKEIRIGVDDLIRQDAAGGTALPAPLRRGLGDGRALVGFPHGGTGQVRQAHIRRAFRAHGDPDGRGNHAGPAPTLVSLALYRRPHPGRGHQRTGLHRDRHLRQADAQAERRDDPPGRALEIRLQVDQVDRALHLHRRAARRPVGRGPATGIRFLRQRQSGGRSPALVPGDRTSARLGDRVPTLLYNGYAEQVAGRHEETDQRGR